MENCWVNMNGSVSARYEELMKRTDLVVVEIDGKKTQTKDAFMAQIEEALHFPVKCAGSYSRLEDQIMDLSWLPKDQGVLIQITDYQEMLKEDEKAWKNFEIILRDALAFWKDGATKYIKGGKSREFYVVVFDRE